MDFELTEEQKMLKDTVARFVEKEITPRAAEWDEQEAFPSEVFRAVGKAMEVFGGYGFIREFPIQRFFRDIKGIEFGAGTNQIQRMIILKNLLNGTDAFPL